MLKKAEILAMLRDDKSPLDADAVIAFIEHIDAQYTEMKADVNKIVELLSVDDLEACIEPITTMQASVTELETIKAELDELLPVLEARREKLVTDIANIYEQLEKSQQAITGFKTRSAKMSFEELDGELDEAKESLREKLGVEPRVTDPPEPSASTEGLTLTRLQNYRV